MDMKENIENERKRRNIIFIFRFQGCGMQRDIHLAVKSFWR